MTATLTHRELPLPLTPPQHDEYRLLTALDSEPKALYVALEAAGLKAEGAELTPYHRHLLYQATRQYQTARFTERDGQRGLVLTGIGEARRAVLAAQLERPA